MTARPFLSVITRTQGSRPRALLETIASLARQDDDDLESLVIVHHGSGAAGIVQEVHAQIDQADPRPRRMSVIAAEGGGRAHPLNVGLDAAAGSYVAFLDDDDLSFPDWVRTFHNSAQTAPGSVVRASAFSQRWTVDETNQPAEPDGEMEPEFPENFDLFAHLDHNATPNCSVAFPTDLVRDSGLRFDEQLLVLEDWDFLLRAIARFGVHAVADRTSLYRRLSSGNSFDHSPDVWVEARQRVLDRLDGDDLLLPPGSARRISALGFRSDGASILTDTQAALDAVVADRDRLAAELARMAEWATQCEEAAHHARARASALESSRWWRLTAPGRRLVSRLRAGSGR